MSLFQGLGFAPVIEVFDLNRRFYADESPDKVNLGLGAYRNDDGEPWVLPVVHKAEELVVSNRTLNHEYLPICGLPEFNEAATRLALGSDSSVIKENRVLSIQTIGGTGSLRLAAEFLKQKLHQDTVLISTLTWDNHSGIVKATGYSQVNEYRYWNPGTKGLDLDGLLADLQNAREKTVVVLHTCAHNTTATDPSPQQWKQIVAVLKERKLIPVMDCTYQGFASGDVDEDAYPLRLLASEGVEFLIAQSFSKNFGLYNERLGNLSIITKDSSTIDEMRSQCEMIIRRIWANPPHHGARVVATILNDKSLYQEWKDQVRTMSDRIKLMRKMLHERLVNLKTPGDWNHVLTQTGMFFYTGMTSPQVEYVTSKFHIYLTKMGRINMCAMTTKNVDYVSKAIHEAVTTQ
ncbi:aspartate aminotransferase, cytoplasmic [Patella vulgata]|uniref:aspartate aminotransferase, cytoplasmic n=1 Tax=Patella vulgata TaxID=6465 RepID=UPI00217F6764|nr:aspartate aminotransferase, cytoplasmic [Patella vulgata]